MAEKKYEDDSEVGLGDGRGGVVTRLAQPRDNSNLTSSTHVMWKAYTVRKILR